MISRETLIVTALGAAVGVWPGLVLASHLACGMEDRGLLPGTFRGEPGISRSWQPWRGPGGRAGRVLRRGAPGGPDPAHRGTGRGGRPDPVHRLGQGAAGAAAVGTGVLAQVAASVSGPVAPAVTLGVFATAILAVGLLAPVLVRIGVGVLGA